MDSSSPQNQPQSQLQSADVGVADLAASRLMRAAAIAARTAGSIDVPLNVLTAAELDAPIIDTDTDLWERRPLLIRGYKIDREIGSGGQATVYRGVQEATGRSVAIKVISGGPFVSSRRRARFDREAKVLAGFDHPNIVGILDRGRTADGSFFIVMNLVEGVPLDQYWPKLADQPGPLAKLFVKVTRAVDEAHQMGIVHRDLKPSNVLVDRRGEPHILDFGLARLTVVSPNDSLLASITNSGQIIGSVQWCSPEQTGNDDDDAVDFRSDVYSIGVMLYQAIAGKFPYKVDGPLGETLKGIASSIPIPPSAASPVRPTRDFTALDNITLRALEKNRDHRYPTARGFADDLENFLSGRSIVAPLRSRAARGSSIGYISVCAAICVAIGWAGLKTIRHSEPMPVIANLPSLMAADRINFIRIPVGAAMLGSKNSETGRGADETLHRVSFDKFFWMTATPITQEQFSAFMRFDPSDARLTAQSFPVQRVTWNEAEEFCRKLGLVMHRHCRLPTEAEWEYACRASELSAFGDGRTLDDVGWWKGNSGGKLHAVATKAANFWGLYDMHGDVSEWCLDQYGSNQAVGSPLAVDPQTRGDRVVRGGSFLSSQADCRAAARSKAAPETRSTDLGFRVVFDDANQSIGIK